MNISQALNKLEAIFAECDDINFDNLRTIMQLGARCHFHQRTSLCNQICWNLTDAIEHEACGENDEYDEKSAFYPSYTGSWEIVLATLVIEGEWDKIAETANNLRSA